MPLQFTIDEVVAAIFAVDKYKTKARRDGDLIQPEHRAAVDRVLRKLRDEYDRLCDPKESNSG